MHKKFTLVIPKSCINFTTSKYIAKKFCIKKKMYNFKNTKKYGIKNVYVSNGFESREVIDDMKGIIDAVNIDLKCFSNSYYKKELGGNLNQVLENLKHFKKNGIWLEISR